MNLVNLITLTSATLLVGSIVTRAQLINGDFQTGNFNGWTFFNVPNGGLGQPTVILFDTAHTGTPSLSARFEVGQTNGVVTGAQYGGGILQNVTLGAGQLTVFLNIATAGPFINNDGGTFSLLLDGTSVASHQFGSIAPSQTQWSTLNYIGTVGAGTHQIEILMTRRSFTQIGETPYQYLDNITLGGSAVPEPPALLLLPLGLTALVLGRKRET